MVLLSLLCMCEKSSWTTDYKVFPMHFVLKVYSFVFFIYIHNPFGIHFCITYKVYIKIQYGVQIFKCHLLRWLSTLCCQNLQTFVKKLTGLFVCVGFQTVYVILWWMFLLCVRCPTSPCSCTLLYNCDTLQFTNVTLPALLFQNWFGLSKLFFAFLDKFYMNLSVAAIYLCSILLKIHYINRQLLGH